jgi:bidirectional [NiFe] hydrogenase diaphorase subunit
MAKLTINGREVEAKEDQSVLELARAAGIYIPALCYHPAVSPYGSCRLCLVEVKAGNRTRMVTSCCYPARGGIEVLTDTEKVQRTRRGVMELLLARAPGSASLRALAASLGVTEPRFPTLTRGERDCILCGLCVNVCREVMGAAAISFANRGVDRTVVAPFLESSEACMGCGACAAVCPMGTVELRWTEAEVEVAPFKNRVPLMRCRNCGRPITGAPFSQQVEGRLGDKLASAVTLCTACKRSAAALAAKKAAVAS